MKKVFAFYIILILFSLGFVSAVWWNPFSWFEKEELISSVNSENLEASEIIDPTQFINDENFQKGIKELTEGVSSYSGISMSPTSCAQPPGTSGTRTSPVSFSDWRNDCSGQPCVLGADKHNQFCQAYVVDTSTTSWTENFCGVVRDEWGTITNPGKSSGRSPKSTMFGCLCTRNGLYPSPMAGYVGNLTPMGYGSTDCDYDNYGDVEDCDDDQSMENIGMPYGPGPTGLINCPLDSSGCNDDNFLCSSCIWNNSLVFYADKDGDGYTAESYGGGMPGYHCLGYQPSWAKLVENPGDCDDSVATGAPINPFVVESSTTGNCWDFYADGRAKDNNCNGLANCGDVGGCTGASCSIINPLGILAPICSDGIGTDVCKCCGSGACEETIRYYEDCDPADPTDPLGTVGEGMGDKTKYHDLCTDEVDSWVGSCNLVLTDYDCDDSTREIWGPGNDDDGDLDVNDLCDDDGDGVIDSGAGGEDCDDNDAAIFFGAGETTLCTDKKDNDCDQTMKPTEIFDNDPTSGVDCGDNVSCDGQDCSALMEMTYPNPDGSTYTSNICSDGVGLDVCKCCGGMCEEITRYYADCDGDGWGDSSSFIDSCPSLLDPSIYSCDVVVHKGDCFDSPAGYDGIVGDPGTPEDADDGEHYIPGSSNPVNGCEKCDDSPSYSGAYVPNFEVNNYICGNYTSALDNQNHSQLCCNGVCKNDDTFELCGNCASTETGTPVREFNPFDWRPSNARVNTVFGMAYACYACTLNETAGTFVGARYDRATVNMVNSTGDIYETEFKCCGGNSYDSKLKGCCSQAERKDGTTFDVVPPFNEKCCEEQTIKATNWSYWAPKIPFASEGITFLTYLITPATWLTKYAGLSEPVLKGLISDYVGWIGRMGSEFKVNKTGNFIVVQRDDEDYCLGDGYSSGNSIEDTLGTDGRFDGTCTPCGSSKKTNTIAGQVLSSVGVFFPTLETWSTYGSFVPALSGYSNLDKLIGLRGFPRYNRVCFKKASVSIIGLPIGSWQSTKCGECDPKDNTMTNVQAKFRLPLLPWPNWNIYSANRKTDSVSCTTHHVNNHDPAITPTAYPGGKVSGGFFTFIGGSSYDGWFNVVDYSNPDVAGPYYCNPEGQCEVQDSLVPGIIKFMTKKVIVYGTVGMSLYNLLKPLKEDELEQETIDQPASGDGTGGVTVPETTIGTNVDEKVSVFTYTLVETPLDPASGLPYTLPSDAATAWISLQTTQLGTDGLSSYIAGSYTDASGMGHILLEKLTLGEQREWLKNIWNIVSSLPSLP